MPQSSNPNSFLESQASAEESTKIKPYGAYVGEPARDSKKSAAPRARVGSDYLSGDNNNDDDVYANNDQHNHRSQSAVLRRRSSSKRNGRESFAATMWNPMSIAEKARFNRRRLIQLTVGVLIACCGGSSFAFGIFSNKIKETAHFTQAEMTTITTAGAVLGAFTFPAGILFDLAGPQYVLGVSTVLCCSGFALLSLIFKGIVEPTVVTVSVANALTAMGVGFTDCGSLMTNLFSFPLSRGEVLIIQKTFFGLGSTFLALSFDGFFGHTQDYIGYAVFVCALMAVAGVLGTAVTRLPPYKRTALDLKRIAKLSPARQEAERLLEERSFELYHNPRLVDRRRLNAGVTCLILTLIFFSSFSIAKTYVEISSGVVTALTVVAVACLASFAVMVSPFKLPAFFDYEFLPDIHPPEALVDNEDDDDDDNDNGPIAVRPHDSDSQRQGGGGGQSQLDFDDGAESVVSASKGHEYIVTTSSATINGDSDVSASASLLNAPPPPRGGGGGRCTINEYDGDAVENCGQRGRASVYFGPRASVAGNSAPIAVPQAIAPSVIPSITTPFTTSILRPMLWCFFLTAFAMTGANAVLVSNIAQIITSANDGAYDQRSNSLAIALQGIGSACGRILVGFLETYFQRRNALAREEQLVWEAENGPYDPNAPPKPGQPNMTPVYHRLSSSVVLFLPITPAIVAVCSLLCTLLPTSAIPPVVCVFGAGHGAYLGLLALGVREMFSVDIAKHYNFVAASGMLSAILLNRLMFGTWFDEETSRHPAGADGTACAGHVCFAKSLYVLAGLCALAVGSSAFIVLSWLKIRRTF